MWAMFKEFRKFILRGNVVDLAVGVVIGAAFTSVINSVVTNIITPLISAIYGGHEFSKAVFHFRSQVFNYGAVINSLITFLIVAAVVFFVVVQPINKLTELSIRRKDTEEAETKKCQYCLSVVPREATRCKFCTSELEDSKG
jgi:large conductance mechanosensitive channel